MRCCFAGKSLASQPACRGPQHAVSAQGSVALFFLLLTFNLPPSVKIVFFQSADSMHRRTGVGKTIFPLHVPASHTSEISSAFGACAPSGLKAEQTRAMQVMQAMRETQAAFKDVGDAADAAVLLHICSVF